MYYKIHTDNISIVKKVYHWSIIRPQNNLIIFNIILVYFIYTPYLYSVNNDKQNKNTNKMQHLSNFLLIWQLVLFVIILSNMARLLMDYLTSKIN
jgi:hypothetical protein